MKLKLLAYLILNLLIFIRTYSQESSNFTFSVSSKDSSGLDQLKYLEWSKKYETSKSSPTSSFKCAYKSLRPKTSGSVILNYSKRSAIQFEKLKIIISETKTPIKYFAINENSFELILPESSTNYSVEVLYEDLKVAELRCLLFPEKIQKIKVVPLVNGKFSSKNIEKTLNFIYQSVGIKFQVDLENKFSSKNIENTTSLYNPPESQALYTLQMREIRDEYLSKHAVREEVPLFFIVDEFLNKNIKGYMPRNKGLGFVNEKNYAYNIARQYALGFCDTKETWKEKGPEKGTTSNLLDTTNQLALTHFQWLSLRSTPDATSYYDDYEHVATNNGLVAFYFWKTKKDGTIDVINNSFLESVSRPYKKNTFSYHLNINNFAYIEVFAFNGKSINVLHLASVVIILFVAFWYGRKFRKFLKKRYQHSRFLRIILWLAQPVLILISIYGSIILINFGYGYFEIDQGEVTELKGKSRSNSIRILGENTHPTKLAESDLNSETVIETKRRTFISHQKRILYFDLICVGEKIKSIKFNSSTDKITTLTNLKIPEIERNNPRNHYLIIRRFTDSGTLISEKLVNHNGQDLTPKLAKNDPSQRILVFVNGYRPTSLSNSLEKNISDIQSKGLEFPNSYNQVFNYDRYNYWHPWNNFDELFKARINPNLVFYADGHHSVATSNHLSLMNFTSISALYPKRCKNINKHTCSKVETTSSGKKLKKLATETYSLHRTRSNKRGFRTRRIAGRIAGKNLLQLLNELPNSSKNDTLIFVAHSMGYAYSLGMTDILKGEINFGSFYIIAPENAGAGTVSLKDWQEIIQYGSRFNGRNDRDKPCLLDGIAPQTCVRGLSEKNRLYIPNALDKKKGFFDSHFIGYYTWIFDIKPTQKGNVKQR